MKPDLFMELPPRDDQELGVILARFNLNLVSTTTGCWEWRGYTRSGYPAINFKGKLRAGHRAVCSAIIGRELKGSECACHHCDNKRCMRPSHLFVGSHRDNWLDSHRKGRDSKPPGFKGEQHPLATLDDAGVEQLRQLAAAGWSQRRLAARFSVSQGTVWNMIHGVTRAGRGTC